MRLVRQALRMLVRDWRSGELGVLAAAIAIAVASITSVAFFSDRVQRALVRDAHQLLGADLVLVSDRPWGREIAAGIGVRGLAAAESVSFISMAQHGEAAQLAGVKAVGEAYPLRGRLRSAPALNAPDAVAERGPRPGAVWPDERLAQALSLVPGGMLRLGHATLEVEAILTLEPERGANFFNIAPRLMMNIADLEATGLIQTGSRVRYYLYAAGERRAVEALEAWARTRMERGQRVDNLESGRPEVRQSLDRAQSFLGLTALLAAVLAGVAIAFAARRFVERHLDGCAVMRCLGATQRRLLALYGLEFLALGIAASAVGAAAGYAAQALIAELLAGMLGADLPPASLQPALQGFLVGLALLLGFALPPIMQLKNVPASRVIRREAGAPRAGTLAAYLAGFGALALLLVWQAGDPRLGLTVVGGFSVAVAVFVAAGWLALGAASSMRLWRALGARSAAFRYGIANLRRHARANAVQVAGLSLGLTALLLLAVTRADLIEAWKRSAPPDAPNRFILGIQPEQLEPVRAFFAAGRLGSPEFYPMIRARLVAVNGRTVTEADYDGERAKRLIEREFNFSYSERLPGHNLLVRGRWFAGAGEPEVSMEEGIMRTLGLAFGDRLTWQVGAETFTARIGSVRKLKWDSMKVNFFAIGEPRQVRDLPTSWVSAFRVEADDEAAVSQLAARFPNVTVVDVGAALKQAQGVVDQLVLAVQVVFLFALGAGLVVLYAALVATEDERRREAALLRVHGASGAQVKASQRAEFLAMGAVAGLLATAGAAAIGHLLAAHIFELELPFNWRLWVLGPLAGVALLSLNAWLSSRKVLKASPALVLREDA